MFPQARACQAASSTPRVGAQGGRGCLPASRGSHSAQLPSQASSPGDRPVPRPPSPRALRCGSPTSQSGEGGQPRPTFTLEAAGTGVGDLEDFEASAGFQASLPDPTTRGQPGSACPGHRCSGSFDASLLFYSFLFFVFKRWANVKVGGLKKKQSKTKRSPSFPWMWVPSAHVKNETAWP